jgi:hypothetical protein
MTASLSQCKSSTIGIDRQAQRKRAPQTHQFATGRQFVWPRAVRHGRGYIGYAAASISARSLRRPLR